MHTITHEAMRTLGRLILEDGPQFEGYFFGHVCAEGDIRSGETVFNTGLVGYPETLTDPSYRGQILVLTQPLVGNYGVPSSETTDGISRYLESNQIHVRGLIVTDYSFEHSHHAAVQSLDAWLKEQRVPGLYGIDTRALTKYLRERGTTIGLIGKAPSAAKRASPVISFPPSGGDFFVGEVSTPAPVFHQRGSKTVVLVDCGVKHNILRSLLARDLSVLQVPWDHDFTTESYDGILLSNGPGDPAQCEATVAHVRTALAGSKPIFGICLGNQIMALAAGARTYKLPYGHRGQNQPCIDVRTKRCVITSQNHGYAVDETTLPKEWEGWFRNLNDGTNEGIRHRTKPFMSVQFHPEATPGPTDTALLFDEFTELL